MWRYVTMRATSYIHAGLKLHDIWHNKADVPGIDTLRSSGEACHAAEQYGLSYGAAQAPPPPFPSPTRTYTPFADLRPASNPCTLAAIDSSCSTLTRPSNSLIRAFIASFTSTAASAFSRRSPRSLTIAADVVPAAVNLCSASRIALLCDAWLSIACAFAFAS